MGLKFALLPALVALLTTPIGAYALGLGNIKIKSALDQPLDAEIDLQVASSAELEGLRVMLASDQLFRNAAVDRSAFLSNIRFTLAKKADGTPFIRVSSNQPVREPFLNFLVEAAWSNGRAVRQYTVLVDPPVSTQDSPPAITPARSSTAVRTPAATPATSASNSTAAPVPAKGELVSRMTKRNDTLWIIANEMRAGTGASAHQMMVALQRQNADAFYQGNVNRLKAGYVLRLKDASLATAVNKAQAVAELHRQYAEWKGIKQVAPKVRDASDKTAVPPAKKDGQPAAATAGSQPKLKLVGVTGRAAGGGGDTKAGGLDKLHQDVVLANENMIARQQEADELRKRVAALEAQISNMQKSVTLKNQQLAAMQGPAEPAPTPEAEGDLLQNPLALGLAGLLVVLLGAGGWFAAQRRRASASQESILAPPPLVPPVAPVAMAPSSADAKSTSTGDSSFLTDFSVSSIEGIQTEVGEIDPMSEADVYLAYGRFNQAEDIMNQALANDPSRADYRLKLCEIHYAAKDQQRFIRAAEAMRDALGGASGTLWQRVAAMGRELCPESPMFATIFASGAAVAGAATVAAATASTRNAAVEEGGDSDFSGRQFEGAEQATAAAAPSGQDDNAMEFDLSGWMSTTPEQEAAEAEARKKLEGDLEANTLAFDVTGFTSTEKEQNQAPEVNFSNDFSFDTVMLPEAQQSGLPDDMPDRADEETRNTLAESNAPKQDDDFFKDLDLSFGTASVTNESSRSDDSTLAENEIDLSDFAVADSASLESSLKGLDDFDLASFSASDRALDATDIDVLNEDSLYSDIDEVGTKLDLARAYIDMDDKEGARSLLDEIMLEGNEAQQSEAQTLLDKLV